MPPTFLAGFNTPAQFIINSTVLHKTVFLLIIIVYLEKLKCPSSFPDHKMAHPKEDRNLEYWF
jgi:hypothetical protein